MKADIECIKAFIANITPSPPPSKMNLVILEKQIREAFHAYTGIYGCRTILDHMMQNNI